MRVQRSQEVEEIIGTPAGWLTNNGTWMLAIMVIGLTTLASFYSYPDTVAGPMVLSSVDPPRQLKARQDIEIQRVLVAEGDTVAAGQTLMVAKRGGAKWEHVQYLDEQLMSTTGVDADSLASLDLPTSLTLGELQDATYHFQERQALYRSLLAQRLERYTTPELRNMIATNETRIRDFEQKAKGLQEKLDRARESLQQEEGMARSGVQYTERLTTARQRLERAEEAVQRNFGELRATRFDIEMMRNQIDAYRSGRQGSTEQSAIQLREAYEDLVEAVAAWNRSFTTISPVDGQVVLSPAITEDSYVPENGLLATVFPLEAGSTVGRIDLDVRGSGKVARGQRVVIDFPKWPALEYGSVIGEITEIGLVPVDGKITVLVSFPLGLTTNTGFNISPEPFLQGEATIIIDKQPLIRRLLGQS